MCQRNILLPRPPINVDEYESWSETSVYIYPITRCHIQEDSRLHVGFRISADNSVIYFKFVQSVRFYIKVRRLLHQLVHHLKNTKLKEHLQHVSVLVYHLQGAQNADFKNATLIILHS
jgi:hypothetical protein